MLVVFSPSFHFSVFVFKSEIVQQQALPGSFGIREWRRKEVGTMRRMFSFSRLKAKKTLA
jgi:hypothetical protein